MDGRTDGRTNGLAVEWTDRRTDRLTYLFFCPCVKIPLEGTLRKAERKKN
jgi:hypothetical protein